ncbi:MAG: hypothetical protein WCJ35_22550 [Planctomycetota bacterium]
MTREEKIDEVCKWCDLQRWNCAENGGRTSLEVVKMTVDALWIFEHSDELRQKANSRRLSQATLQTLEGLIEEGRVHKSGLDLRAKHGEKVVAFFVQISRLKADWASFKLFENSRAFATQFGNSHKFIALSLFESVVLQLTRLLTDGKKVRGRKVLTIDTLVEEILHDHPEKARFISRIKEVKDLPIVRNLRDEWRHIRVAHNNYDAALGSTVPTVKIDEMDEAIVKFLAVFQELGKQLIISYDVAVEHLTIPDFAEEIARLGLDQLAQTNPRIAKA